MRFRKQIGIYIKFKLTFQRDTIETRVSSFYKKIYLKQGRLSSLENNKEHEFSLYCLKIIIKYLRRTCIVLKISHKANNWRSFFRNRDFFFYGRIYLKKGKLFCLGNNKEHKLSLYCIEVIIKYLRKTHVYSWRIFSQSRHAIESIFNLYRISCLTCREQNLFIIYEFKIISRYTADKSMNNSQFTIDAERLVKHK